MVNWPAADSLGDFAMLVEPFDAHAVSFVSVTQQFNTTIAVGLLTLNVLESFAQLERELMAERIGNKIAASKKKGMWMVGQPPLGCYVKDKKLAFNHAEADHVRRIFEAYVVSKAWTCSRASAAMPSAN